MFKNNKIKIIRKNMSYKKINKKFMENNIMMLKIYKKNMKIKIKIIKKNMKKVR
jgi:hypothetical protein